MLSLVIPVYNAQNIIRASCAVLSGYLEARGYDYEIIFEDDGSTDSGKAVLEALSRADPRVKVFSHFPNRGLGYTLRELFRRSSADTIIYLDIDLSFGMECLPRLLEEAKGFDAVAACRYLLPENKIPFLRKVSSELYYLLCRVLFKVGLRDIGSGFVVFNKRALEAVNLKADGFDIHIEILTRLKEKGFRVKEVPSPYNYKGYSTFSILKHGPGIVINTLRFWLTR